MLPDALVDQIAAGEVVERPASVIKELLENAVDAGARSLTVEMDGGGVARMRVTDDGHGMSPEDATVAVTRHATSKIATAADLETIRTLGFRGEALPSIASVSRFTLTTREPDAVVGTRLRIDGGGPTEVREAGCAPGTTVEVFDLFYNVPARRKFLKSQPTESAHAAEACLRVALSRPALRLTLLRDGRRAREYLPAPDHAGRAQQVFTGERLTELRGSRDGVGLHALLGPPEKARTGAAALHVFVNGRPVRDRALARAVAFAYGSVLPPGRFPTGVVWLELDPTEVDVNVHPQKAEVRFAKGRHVLDAITRLLASQLGTAAWSGPAARGAQYWKDRLDGTGATAPADAQAGDPWGLAGAIRDTTAEYAPSDGSSPELVSAPGAAPPGSVIIGSHAAQPELVPSRGLFGSLRALAQVRRMLIVCEGPDALHVIDQHAADERLRFHRLRAAYRASDVAVQRLLFPERVEVTSAEAALVDERRDELAALGLDVAAVGSTTVAVHAVPALVQRAAPERLLRDVLDEIDLGGERAFGDAVDMALATMACHGSIRAGDSLSLDECQALLRALDTVDDFASHCPHGRPIVYSVALGEIERRLGR